MLDERILVVDDETAVREVLVAVLEHGGYAVTAASSVEEALVALKRDRRYDLVLSDITMPGRDGFSLLDSVTEAFPELPVVMVSALQDLQVAVRAFRKGAADYVLKPFERVPFLGVVKRAIEKGQLAKKMATHRENLEAMVALRTGRLREAMEDLEQSYDTTLEAMGDALDLRDEETEGHSRRVTAYTIELARAMGVPTDDMKVIARGAFLHDIGKIATPDSILLKPGKLDECETRIMREHCARGYEIVRKIPFLKDASEIVYAHQERFDGKGYPRKLQGEEIPLGARIFAIADAMDAMTSDRPYRKATSFEHARVEIERCAGVQFDPEITEVFLEIPIGRWEKIRLELDQLGDSAKTAKLWRRAVA